LRGGNEERKKSCEERGVNEERRSGKEMRRKPGDEK